MASWRACVNPFFGWFGGRDEARKHLCLIHSLMEWSKALERRSAISSLWDRQLKKVRLSETKRQSAKSSSSNLNLQHIATFSCRNLATHNSTQFGINCSMLKITQNTHTHTQTHTHTHTHTHHTHTHAHTHTHTHPRGSLRSNAF